MQTNLIERARRYIAKCPAAISGQRGHNATFHVAAVLVHGFALDAADALPLIREWNTTCVPPWPEAKLIYKLKSAQYATHRERRGFLVGDRMQPQGKSPAGVFPKLEPVRKPEFKAGILKRIAAKTSVIPDVAQFIAARSPVRCETQDSASVLRRLYARGSGEKILIFTELKSQGELLWEADKSDGTQNQHLPRGAEGVWFLPQPVDGAAHPNPRADGKLSRRSEESVTAWRYAVLESDAAEPDDWLRCLVQLPLRIACVCESGGRSIHALVRVDAASKMEWDVRIAEIKPILITLGADRGALSAVRLSRLPQAKRGERVQRLHYLNVHPNGVPILNQPHHAPTSAAMPNQERITP